MEPNITPPSLEIGYLIDPLIDEVDQLSTDIEDRELLDLLTAYVHTLNELRTQLETRIVLSWTVGQGKKKDRLGMEPGLLSALKAHPSTGGAL